MRRARLLLGLWGAGLLCVLIALAYLRGKQREAAAQAGTPRQIPADRQFTDPLLLPTADPDDPSQLVMPELLYGERDGNPLRLTPEGGKVTLVDFDLLAGVIAAVKSISQQELEARVDETIVWEDFLDDRRRGEIRGRVCQFSGRLYRMVENEAADLSQIGLEHLYEGQIRDALGRMYSFYCFEKPGGETVSSDVAILTGVFYKLIKYTDRAGEDLVTPLIVARTITFRPGYRPPRSLADRVIEQAPPWALWAGFAAVVAVIIAVTSFLMGRKPPPLRRRRF